MTDQQSNTTRTATFAGGCFWCMQPPFDQLDGVEATVPGYTGGHKENPTYQEICGGETGHAEALQVHFDPAKISYAELLDVFWRNINPADPDGQFVDRGPQYRPAIFYHDEEQRRLAEESRARLDAARIFTAPVKVEISPADDFYPAEEYHQDYYRKSPVRYKSYRYSSGRDQFLKKIWGER